MIDIAAAAAPSMRSVFEPQSAPGVGGIAEAPDVTGPPSSPSTSDSRAIWYLASASMLAAVALAGVVGWYGRGGHHEVAGEMTGASGEVASTRQQGRSGWAQILEGMIGVGVRVATRAG